MRGNRYVARRFSGELVVCFSDVGFGGAHESSSSHTDNGRRLAVGEPKTRKSRRTVRLTQRAVEALRSHRKRQLEEKLRVGGLYQDQGLVFTGEGGGLINPSNLRQRSFMPARFVRVLDSLGYTRFRRWRIYGRRRWRAGKPPCG